MYRRSQGAGSGSVSVSFLGPHRFCLVAPASDIDPRPHLFLEHPGVRRQVPAVPHACASRFPRGEGPTGSVPAGGPLGFYCLLRGALVSKEDGSTRSVDGEGGRSGSVAAPPTTALFKQRRRGSFGCSVTGWKTWGRKEAGRVGCVVTGSPASPALRNGGCSPAPRPVHPTCTARGPRSGPGGRGPPTEPPPVPARGRGASGCPWRDGVCHMQLPGP